MTRGGATSSVRPGSGLRSSGSAARQHGQMREKPRGEPGPELGDGCCLRDELALSAGLIAAAHALPLARRAGPPPTVDVDIGRDEQVAASAGRERFRVPWVVRV